MKSPYTLLSALPTSPTQLHPTNSNPRLTPKKKEANPPSAHPQAYSDTNKSPTDQPQPSSPQPPPQPDALPATATISSIASCTSPSTHPVANSILPVPSPVTAHIRPRHALHTSFLHRPAVTSRENVRTVFPPAAYTTKSRATVSSREAGRAGLLNAPIGSLSASPWTIVPGRAWRSR